MSISEHKHVSGGGSRAASRDFHWRGTAAKLERPREGGDCRRELRGRRSGLPCRASSWPPMKNLAHSASLESLDKNAPSKGGTKHLVHREANT